MPEENTEHTMDDILISNTLAILPVAGKPEGRRCSVAVKDGRIRAILPPEARVEAVTVIDGSSGLLTPGLVNAHTHAYMTGMRCWADDLQFDDWLFGRVMPKEDALTPEDAYWFSLLGCLEMLSGGVTAYLDMHMFPHKSLQAAVDSGMRSVISRGLSGGGDDVAGGVRRLREAKEEIAAHKGEKRISFMLAPHAPYTCTEDYLREVAQAAAELDVGIHTHLSETKGEVENTLAQSGCTPIGLYDRCGLLSERTVAAHCVHLTEADMELLAERKVSVATNPASNLKLANGFAPVPELLKKGVNVCLGTDSTASNNSLSVLRELGLVTLLHKGRTGDPCCVTAAEGFRMATVNGCRALGLPGGEIVEGAPADLALFDLNVPGLVPLGDPVAAIAYAGQSLRADTVVVDGEIVWRHGKSTRVDMGKVLAKAQETCKKLGM